MAGVVKVKVSEGWAVAVDGKQHSGGTEVEVPGGSGRGVDRGRLGAARQGPGQVCGEADPAPLRDRGVNLTGLASEGYPA